MHQSCRHDLPALALALVLLAGACGAQEGDVAPTEPQARQVSTEQDTPAARADIPAVVRIIEPSVVTIYTPDGLGSGVVYRSEGLIVTNAHVVGQAPAVEVRFASGERVDGRTIAADEATDLAVVRVARQGLPTARFAEGLPKVGETVVAVGSPLGLDNTVTAGIVSGLGRTVPGEGPAPLALVDLIQTDAAISPGNSGGVLVDTVGTVTGIAVAYLPPDLGAVSIGFAIPAPTAKRVADQLIADGRATHAYLGVDARELTPDIARQFGLPVTDGVIVVRIAAGGPAAKAGIAVGDVIVSLGGAKVSALDDLLGALRRHEPGDQVAVEIVRGGERRTLDVFLESLPEGS
jgi:serine protease DegQ